MSIDIFDTACILGYMSSDLIKQMRDAIRNSGLPVVEIARQAGISQGQLSRFMRNQRTLTLPVAEKVCDVLGLELRPSKQTIAKKEGRK